VVEGYLLKASGVLLSGFIMYFFFWLLINYFKEYMIHRLTNLYLYSPEFFKFLYYI